MKNSRKRSTAGDEPAGGIELYKALQSLAEEYRLRATAERDFEAAALALALEALVFHAARAGGHVHLKFGTVG